MSGGVVGECTLKADGAGVIAGGHDLGLRACRLAALFADFLRLRVVILTINEHHDIGILLTGMGRDGAVELRDMRDLGATTIAQDEETSAVHGMPGEAIRLKGARYILPPDRIVSVVERRLPANVIPPPKAAACG